MVTIYTLISKNQLCGIKKQYSDAIIFVITSILHFGQTLCYSLVLLCKNNVIFRAHISQEVLVVFPLCGLVATSEKYYFKLISYWFFIHFHV